MSQTLDQVDVEKCDQSAIGKCILESISCRVEPKKEVLQGFAAEYHSEVGSVVVKLGSLLPADLLAEDRLSWLKLIAVNFGWSKATASEFSYSASSDHSWPSLGASVAYKLNKAELTEYLQVSANADNESLAIVKDLLQLDLVVSIIYDKRKLCVTDKTELAIALARQLLTQKTTEVVEASLFTADDGHVTTQLVWMDYVEQSTDAKSCAVTSRVCCGQIKLIGYIPQYLAPPASGLVGGIPLRSVLLQQPLSQVE
jgi:hypothetical protein